MKPSLNQKPIFVGILAVATLCLAPEIHAQVTRMPGMPTLPGVPTLPGAATLPEYPAPLPPTLPSPIVLPDGTVLPPQVGMLMQWCDRTAAILNSAQITALQQSMQGNVTQATSTLVAAMQRALQATTLQGRAGTITGISLARGIRLVSELRAQAALDEMDLRATFNFASEWINLILNTARGLDQAYYIPFRFHYAPAYGANCSHHDCNYPPAFNYAQFQMAYFSWASAQLDLITQRLVLGYNSVGSPRFVFRAANKIVGEVVRSDLSTNPFAYNSSCEIAALVDVMTTIQYSLAVPNSDLLIRQNFYSVIETLRMISPRLGAESNCHNSHH
jgi:hypothetical protein